VQRYRLSSRWEIHSLSDYTLPKQSHLFSDHRLPIHIAYVSFSCFFITMHNIGILGKINQLRILQLFGFYHGFNFSEQTAMTIKLNQAYFRKVITKMDIV